MAAVAKAPVQQPRRARVGTQLRHQAHGYGRR
jgi:hypothetical protein